jgi:predicted nucleic acid-binding protein
MRYLFDTSALLAHYRHETGWEEIQRIFEEEKAEIFLSSVSLTEFARRLNGLGASNEDIEQTLSDYEMLFSAIISIDHSIARVAYPIGQASEARLPLIDALIAAAAQRHDAILVHRDRHMAGIPKTVLDQRYLQNKPKDSEAG